MNSIIKKVGIGTLIAILCAVAFYFFYWTKTPTYSLGIIKEAVEKHDVMTFEKHVDLDSLYNKAIDDAMIGTAKIEGRKVSDDILTAGFMQMVKPSIIAMAKAATLEAIKREPNKEPEPTKAFSSRQEAAQNEFLYDLEKKSGLGGVKIKDLSTLSKEGSEAIVALKLHNEQLGKDFSLQLKMTKLDDGTWKVKEIANLVDFMVEIDTAKKEKVAELNKDIQAQLDQAVSITATPLQATTKSTFFSSYRYVVGELVVKNTSSKPIKSGYIHYTITGFGEGKDIKKGIAFSPQSLEPNQETRLPIEIDIGYAPEDKALFANPTNYQPSGVIKSLTYTDDTTLELLRELPEKTAK